MLDAARHVGKPATRVRAPTDFRMAVAQLAETRIGRTARVAGVKPASTRRTLYGDGSYVS